MWQTGVVCSCAIPGCTVAASGCCAFVQVLALLLLAYVMCIVLNCVRAADDKVERLWLMSLTGQICGINMLAARVEHPQFGSTWVCTGGCTPTPQCIQHIVHHSTASMTKQLIAWCRVTAHLTADPVGMLTGDRCCGSLQLAQMNTMIEFVESQCKGDNLVICGDFNELQHSLTVQRLLQSKGRWGSFIDCGFETSQSSCCPSGQYARSLLLNALAARGLVGQVLHIRSASVLLYAALSTQFLDELTHLLVSRHPDFGCVTVSFVVSGSMPSSCCPPVKPCCYLPPGLLRIDYCMMSEKSVHLWPHGSFVDDATCSDHLPLIVDFRFRNRLTDTQPYVPRKQIWYIRMQCIATMLFLCGMIVVLCVLFAQ